MGAPSEQDRTVVFRQAGGEPCSGCRPSLEDKRQVGNFLLWDCIAKHCYDLVEWFSRTSQPANLLPLLQANVSCDSEINKLIINKGSVAGEGGELWLDSPVASGAAHNIELCFLNHRQCSVIAQAFCNWKEKSWTKPGALCPWLIAPNCVRWEAGL